MRLFWEFRMQPQKAYHAVNLKANQEDMIIKYTSFHLGHMFFGTVVLLIYMVFMEILLLWQQRNCTITQLYKSILSSYLAHMFL